MRSSRGYLDTLVRSVRPVAATAVHAVRQPDWGPTRFPAPDDDPEAVEPTPEAAPQPRARPLRAGAPLPAPPPLEVRAAAPPPVVEATVRHPAPPPPAIPTHVEKPLPLGPAATHHAREERAAPKIAAAVPPLSSHPRPVPAQPAAIAPRDVALTQQPRLPAGSAVALERLEHLTRRFSAAFPVKAELPAPAADVARRDDARAEPAEHSSEPGRVTVAAPPAPSAVAPGPARVEIGSIEVFVTQRPSPGPVAASVAPARVVVAAPPVSDRLSRPVRPYGFGQR